MTESQEDDRRKLKEFKGVCACSLIFFALFLIFVITILLKGRYKEEAPQSPDLPLTNFSKRQPMQFLENGSFINP